MLQKDPELRMSASEILEELSDGSKQLSVENDRLKAENLRLKDDVEILNR